MNRVPHCVICLSLLICAGGARSQTSDPGTTRVTVSQNGGQTQPEASDAKSGALSGSLSELFERIEDAEPVRQAGLKAALLRQVQQALPFVVLVDDAPSYLYAISQWEAMLRFPVLWDDGSVESREHIARFVRAYQPEKVLRLEDDGDWQFGRGRDERAASIEKALAKALSEQRNDWRDSIESINAQGIVSPGIVLTDPGDSAWPAALALAAGRFQPIGFMTKPAHVWKPLEPEAADLIEREAERLATSTGRSWAFQGDEIDAITLAMNTGTQIKTGSGARARLATSDRIGRREHNGAGDRWAWCGQIVGSEARVTYQAMCSLFLELDQAFIWDGYGSGEPWIQYDGSEAATALEGIGMRVELNDQPKHTIDHWYQRMVNPIGDLDGDAGSALLMLMNSKGASTKFDLPGEVAEEGRAGDLPVLEVPTALHIVHSFSLQQPMNRRTVGGRLLERGVYAYAGSVDEPYLSGFVPTPAIAQRLGAGVSFGAAVRWQSSGAKANPNDLSRVWKIAVLGDPLMTFGSAGRRVQAELQIDSLIDLDEQSKRSLKDGDYATSLQDLVLLGRDTDAARLAKALINDKPEAFTPEIALVALPALHRAGEFTAMVDCYDRLDEAGRADGLMQDLLWLASPYLLARGEMNDATLLSRVEALLRSNLRPGQEIRDAERLAMRLRARSMGSALRVLESLREGLNENQAKMLDQAIERVRR
ncbi:MAG: hypothetical protein ACF8MF_12590 [Phycisphaerales bacterium JB052]